MKTRRELLAGFSGALLLAGCTSDGNDNGTTAPNSPTTHQRTTTENHAVTEGPNTTTEEPEPTPEETPTEEPPQTPTETNTPTPEEEDSLEEIYQEHMVHAYNSIAERRVDWDQVRDELEGQGFDLDNVEASSEFIEYVAGYAGKQVNEDYGAAALAYGLHEEFGIGTDEVIVDARTFTAGQRAPIGSVLITQDDGSVVKDMYRPGGQRQRPEEQGDVLSYQRHDEPNPRGAEETVQQVWNSEIWSTFTWLDKDGLEALLNDGTGSGYITRNGQDTVGRMSEDFLIGYEGEINIDSEGGEVAYTPEAFEKIGEVLDPTNINTDPQTTGVMARNFVVKASTMYHNKVDRSSNDFLEIGYSEEESFQYDIVGKDRKEELEHALLEEYVQEN